jgi:hypothetical protein
VGGDRDSGPLPGNGARAKKRLAALHRAFLGRGPAPEEWLISQVCESFGCLPSDAVREIEETPAGLIWRILEMREYRRLLQESQQPSGDEDGPVEEFGDDERADTLQELMRQIAAEIEGEIADEALGRR